MRPYRVEFTDDANREFTELSYILKRRVNRMLPELRNDPFAEGTIELDNNPTGSAATSDGVTAWSSLMNQIRI